MVVGAVAAADVERVDGVTGGAERIDQLEGPLDAARVGVDDVYGRTDVQVQAAQADEPLEMNFIRAHALDYAEKMGVDLETAALRVFSNAEGAYGSNVNLPFPAGTAGDTYRAAFDEVVVPLVERFAPTWLIISAGLVVPDPDNPGKWIANRGIRISQIFATLRAAAAE